MTDAVRRRPPWPRSGSTGCTSSSSAAPSRSIERESAAPRRCSSKVRAARIRRSPPRRTRQNKLVHFRAAAPGPDRLLRDGRGHRRGAAPPRRRAARGARRADAQASTRRPARLTEPPAADRRARADRERQERRSQWRSRSSAARPQRRRRAAGGRDRRRRRDAGLPAAWTSAPPSRRPPTAPGRAPLHRPRRARPRTSPSAGVHRRGDACASPRSSAAARMPLLVAGTGLYLRALTDPMDVPGHVARRSAPSSRQRVGRRRRRPAARASSPRLDPLAASPDGADQRATRRARAGGVPRQRPPVQLVRARARHVPADARSRMVGLRWPRPSLAERIARACPADGRRGARRRGAPRSLEEPGGAVAHRTRRHSGTRS